MPVIVLGIVSTIALTAGAASMTLAAPNSAATVFEKCGGGHRIACVIDGETLWIDGTKVRIADIDAPEISEPKCASELALGNRATGRLIELINQGHSKFEDGQTVTRIAMVGRCGFSCEMAIASVIFWSRKDFPGPGQVVANLGAKGLGQLRPSLLALNRAVPIRSRC
ncbi:thermonuclease family protein [Agrobacterium deltaense]